MAAPLTGRSLIPHPPPEGDADARVRVLNREVAEALDNALAAVAGGEVRADSLGQRVMDEVLANDSVIVGRAEVGAWSLAPRHA
jgi:hypothetical protein